MPKSKVRKKAEYTPALSARAGVDAKPVVPSPPWYPIALCAVLLVGLAYIVVYYLAGERVPVMQDLGGWNFAVGFTFMVAGLVMAVRWR